LSTRASVKTTAIALIEAAAVFVLLVFDTGAIAGLDLLLRRRKHKHSDTSDETS